MTLAASGSKITLSDLRTEMSVTASPFSLGQANGDIYARVNLTGGPNVNDTYPVKIGEFGGYNHTSASDSVGVLHDGLVLGYWTVLGPTVPFKARWFHNKWWMVQQQGGVALQTVANAYSSSIDSFLPRGAEMLINGAIVLASASYGTLVPYFGWISSSFGGLAVPDSGTFPTPDGYYRHSDVPNDYLTFTSEYNLPATGSVTTLAADTTEVKYLGGITGSYSYSVDLGNTNGVVTLTYNSGELPDRFIVQYSGSNVIDTGFRGDVLHNRALKRRGRIDGISGSASGTATFTKLSPTTGSIVIVQSPLGNTNFGFTLSSPVKPSQQTITFFARVSGSVSPIYTNPKIYWSSNDIYADSSSGYMTGSSVSSSTYVNMGSMQITSGSTISYYPTDVTGSNLSARFGETNTGSFGCNPDVQSISGNTNLYITIELDATGSYVSCTSNIYGSGVYYTLIG
jgi:hypothetical protein